MRKAKSHKKESFNMTKTMRRTKILATLGPATDRPGMMDKIIEAGVNAVRINFSHGSAEDHIARAKYVRETAKKHGTEVGVLVDLQGPKIRVARFKEGKVLLEVGAPFALDANLGRDEGDVHQVGLTYPEIVADVKKDDILLLNDGAIVLKVTSVEGMRINTLVVEGGVLSNSKGINKQGGGLTAPALTEKDKEDIKTAALIDADFLAVSFPRCAEDLHEARRLAIEAGLTNAQIVAKVERAEAVIPEVLDEIILASDIIMVARGDLGVEIGDAQLPAVQKRMISRCRALNRAVITATQMMESMIENHIPTRAEVFDVANAVYDGTDAVMLSAETAAGKNPDKVIEAMSRICMEAEKQRSTQVSTHRIDEQFSRTDESVAMATMYLANHMPDVKVIVALTESGATAHMMSRISSGKPIIALSKNLSTRRGVTLYRGVYPIQIDYDGMTEEDIKALIEQQLKAQGMINDGEIYVFTRGANRGVEGGTNVMELVKLAGS